MKAKKLLCSFALVFALCALLIVAVCAEETDAKIIRFDGMGNVKFTATSGLGKGSINGSGNFYMVMKNSDLYTSKGANIFQPTFKIAAEDAFTVNDYPYVKMKFRTNYPHTVQFYISDNTKGPDGKTHGYIYTAISSVTDTVGKWNVVKMAVPVNNSHVASGYNDGEYTWGIGVATGPSDVAAYPSDELPVPAVPFFQFKSITADEVAALNGKDLYAEIEYIAYFKTEEAMKAYDAETDQYVIGFDGSGNVKYSITTENPTAISGESFGSYSLDGEYLVIDSHNDAFARTTDYRVHLTLANKDLFNVTDYSYVKVKYITDYPDTIQFYMNVPNMLVSDWIYSRKHEGNLSHELNKEITFMYHITPSGAAYNAPDGSTWSMYAAPSPTSKFPDGVENKGPLSKVFFITRYDEGLKAGQHYTTKIKYIAFFKTEEAMKAFDSEESEAFEEAVAKVSGDVNKYVYTVLPGAQNPTARRIEEYVTQKVQEAVGDGVEVYAEADNFKVGDPTCKVIVNISSGDYLTKDLGFTVAIKKLPSFELEIMGAQIRVDDGDAQALRFGTKIHGYDEAAADDGITFGTLIIPAELIKETELTHEVADAVDAEGVKIFEEGEDYKLYTGVLTNIPPEKYDTEITARPYVKYMVDGEPYYVYGDTITRTVNGVKAAVADQGEDFWSH